MKFKRIKEKEKHNRSNFFKNVVDDVVMYFYLILMICVLLPILPFVFVVAMTINFLSLFNGQKSTQRHHKKDWQN